MKIKPFNKAKDILYKTSTNLDKIRYVTKFAYGRLSSSKAIKRPNVKINK